MLDKNKTDYELGIKVHKELMNNGVETPLEISASLDTDSKKKVIEESVHNIMTSLGLDMDDDSLSDTPKRIARMYVDEIFWGLDYHNFPKITTIQNKMRYSSMLLERHIKVHSTCEHHFIPMMGEAFIAYIPNNTVIGLSKINRIVEFFCRRPQVQERLCEQIYYALRYILDTDNVAVLIKAEHTCVKLRGIEDINSDTVTCRLGGDFFEGELKQEFYQMIAIG